MKIQFHGAAEEVTGSCIQITTDKTNIIVDCGLIQGNYRKEQRNFDPFPFDPKSIDAVILTHAHIDHSGRLPVLVKSGFSGPIYSHIANWDILQILLSDSAYLQEKEAEWNNRKRSRKGLADIMPLYTRDDVEPVLSLLKLVDYKDKTEISPEISFCLQNAGHILGSASAEIWLKSESKTKKVVISGDLGNRGSPIQQDPAIITEADLVIMESTYGSRNHQSWQSSIDELEEVLDIADDNGGNVLIPSFALGRTQVLLHYFAKYYKRWNMEQWDIYLDSPMAIKVTEAYKKHSRFYKEDAQELWSESNLAKALPNLHFTADTQQSMAINSVTKGAIIIAGSGMMSGGRIKHHLKHNIWKAQNHLVITGYQAEGTLGRRIVDGVPYIKLWGEAVKVSSWIHTIGGFSAHAGQQGLIDWYQNFKNSPPLMLVHGSSSTLEEFYKILKEKDINDVTIAKKGMLIML